jgi:hypothetical protein
MCIVYITVGGSMGYIGNAVALGLDFIGAMIITATIDRIVVGAIGISGSAVTLRWPPA